MMAALAEPQNQMLDDLDIAILAHLTENGRKSFSEIAEALSVSDNTVRNRYTRMVEQGTLTIVGRVNPIHAGLNAYATIYVSIRPSRLIEDVLAQLIRLPETSFAGIVAGDHDVVVDVMCRDNDHLLSLLTRRIHTLEGVQDTKTIMVLRVAKYGQPILESLRAAAEASLDGKSTQ